MVVGTHPRLEGDQVGDAKGWGNRMPLQAEGIASRIRCRSGTEGHTAQYRPALARTRPDRDDRDIRQRNW
jgi:hypothetical protein